MPSQHRLRYRSRSGQWYFSRFVCGFIENTTEPGKRRDISKDANPPPELPKKMSRGVPVSSLIRRIVLSRKNCKRGCCADPIYQLRISSRVSSHVMEGSEIAKRLAGIPFIMVFAANMGRSTSFLVEP